MADRGFIFVADQLTRAEASRTGSHKELTMITLAELAAPWARVDLLHVDIQGGEADLIAGSLSVLRKKIPTQGGQVFRPDRGHRSDLMAATIPI